MNLKRKIKRSATVTVVMLVFLYILMSYIFDETRHEFLQRRREEPMCELGHPCSYNDTVDLRVIVLTYKRPASLAKLLQSLVDLELDNNTGSLEIWIDNDAKTGKVDRRTVKVASEFRWPVGPTRVHVHRRHVGIYGQWINTWRPRDDSDDELALFLEDDVSVSKYAYRWVRAVFQAYGNRSDFAGVSFPSRGMRILSRRAKGPLAGPKNHTVMMYKNFGTWGFVPKPLHWRRFQEWYHTHKPAVMPRFHPYVPGALPSIWYRNFEKSGKAKNMWSMWFNYYMHINRLYSVYSNLRVYNGVNDSSLVINRFEVGLHFHQKGQEYLDDLLITWKDEFVNFPKDPVRLNWDGSYVPKNRPF